MTGKPEIGSEKGLLPEEPFSRGNVAPAVATAHGEYVVLPDDHHDPAALPSGLVASTWRPQRGGLFSFKWFVPRQ